MKGFQKKCDRQTDKMIHRGAPLLKKKYAAHAHNRFSGSRCILLYNICSSLKLIISCIY